MVRHLLKFHKKCLKQVKLTLVIKLYIRQFSYCTNQTQIVHILLNENINKQIISKSISVYKPKEPFYVAESQNETQIITL